MEIKVVKTILAIAAAAATASARPQRGGDFRIIPTVRFSFPVDAVGPVSRTTARRPGQPLPRQPARQAAGGLLLPAIPAPRLFVRPEYDVFGNPIDFRQLQVPEDEVLPDFRKPQPTTTTTARPKGGRKLAFGQPDFVLRITEELRNRDTNHQSLLPLGRDNAGILPLAVSNDASSLSLFPPFGPAAR